ncbi:carbohydrate ABC transporter permease [Paenibacillus cymbidii]|uniref:carbohydrate ABC transporter permease n=1 Tax=Paenibacillus cymbidii TaxID=1639034 RepID=UPI001081EF30|nr:carbohydrate ABC transporter permease [Paenibacillus cymbidii]
MTLRRFWKPAVFYVLATLLALFALIPFFWMVSTSLKSKGALLVVPIQWIPETISFEGYRKVFTAFPFAQAIGNSLFVSVVSTLITLLSALMAAYVFAKIDFRGKGPLFALFLATMMVPGQVTIIPIFLVLKHLHLLNTYAGLMSTTIFNPFAIFMLRQFMLTVHNDFLDAAYMDGASRRSVFWRIMLPLSVPIITTLGIITFMGSWNDYFWPLVILSDKALMTLPLALSSLSGQYSSEYNTLMAGSLISMLPIIVLYLFAQQFFKAGLQLGGVK